jgi:cytochrome P450
VYFTTGDLWRSRRKLLTPAFHFSILNNFVEVFNEQSRILCGIFGELCQSSPDGKGEIDVYPLITRCSLDIICGKKKIIPFILPNICGSRLHN